jgi:hypothetical protein
VEVALSLVVISENKGSIMGDYSFTQEDLELESLGS